MKGIVLLMLIYLSPAWALGDNMLFIGPLAGATTYSTSSGSTNRDTQFSYGMENIFVHDQWAGGLVYQYFSPGMEGSQTINVTQSNHWLAAEGKYRLWNENFSPYVAVGAGAVFQTVYTTVMGASDKIQGTFFVQDLGIGILGKIADDFGVSLSAKYYQFSNINGFNYFISVGFFPSLKN